MKHRLIQQRANRQAAEYEQVHFLQQEMAKRLLQRLQYVRLQPNVIVDLGSATGWLSPDLLACYPNSKIIALDFAEQRLRLAKDYPCQALVSDMHAIALQEDSVDCIVANDSLHWAQEPSMVIQECMRILKPGGLLMFSTLGPDSLQELKLACHQSGFGQRVSAFMDMHDIGDMLMHNGFSDPVMDREELQLQYRSIKTLCRDIHRLAASQAEDGAVTGLTTPRQWQRLIEAYPTDHPEIFPCTIELLQGHAWKAEQTAGYRMDQQGEVAIPISKISKSS
ncbi:MAG: methyltransferase domain-containing protein [Coxiellaceae bacterium]|nr:methyltransferase domain-containing protein [Coxiellaceae bacterium]